MLNHEEPKYACPCGTTFHRSDYLTKHKAKCSKTINNDNICDVCGAEYTQKCHLNRHKKICEMKQKEKRLEQDTQKYVEKLKEGKQIESILRKHPDIMEEALGDADKEALKLYQSLTAEDSIDMDSIILKPWQTDVIRIIDNPSERDIYWIIGEEGNEGKTFIQKYIHQQFGSRRVLKSEVNTRKADIAYVLSQASLTCKDIFLFNLLRSDIDVSYGLLENIKDGYLISVKYRSKPLKLQTPNTVIVFSNSPPSTDQLSTDRWKIFEIRDNILCRKLKTNWNGMECKSTKANKNYRITMR